MIDLTVSRTKEVARINSAHPNIFDKIEANLYYRIEDEILSPLAKENQLFNTLAEELGKVSFTELKVKKILRHFLEAFKLSDIKIKISRKKNLLSYYKVSRQTIYINQFLLRSTEIKRTKQLLYVLIHELAHAYTCLYFNQDSAHDSFFLKNQLKMLSYITNEPEEYFTDKKVNIECTYKFNYIYQINLRERLKTQPLLVILDDKDLYIKPYSKKLLNDIKKSLLPLKEGKYGCKIFNDFYDEYYFGEYYDYNFVNVKVVLRDDNRFLSFADVGKLTRTIQEQQKRYIESAKVEI